MEQWTSWGGHWASGLPCWLCLVLLGLYYNKPGHQCYVGPSTSLQSFMWINLGLVFRLLCQDQEGFHTTSWWWWVSPATEYIPFMCSGSQWSHSSPPSMQLTCSWMICGVLVVSSSALQSPSDEHSPPLCTCPTACLPSCFLAFLALVQ